MTRTGRFWNLARGLLVAAVTLPMVFAWGPAQAAPSDPKQGLYGSQDPQYDGTFRQSLAILALTAADQQVPQAAVDWLVDQQCADGGWTPFREDTSADCVAKQEDTNSTAMAVQALTAVGGRLTAVKDAVAWLSRQQNDDGGVGYQAGGATDANSTALWAQALNAAEVDPASVQVASDNSPIDALLGLQIGCAAPARERGAFAFQKGGDGKKPNDLATVAALFALSGQVQPVTEAGETPAKALPCGQAGRPDEKQAAAAAAHYLGGVLDRNDDAVPAPQGDGADWGATASAVTALTALGAADEAGAAMAALTEQADTYAKGPNGEDAPASLANLVLAATASGENPRQVAGDAVERLAATGPKPEPASTPTSTREAGNEPVTGGVGWGGIAAVGAVVAIGVLVLLHRRKEGSAR